MPRASEVDTIRGLALFGICVVNVPFLAQPIATIMAPQPGWDGIARFVVEWLFQGKFFVLFSFLFGWGFAIQMASAERAGTSGSRRFRRRLLALGVIGLGHATLVFFGDILLLYAWLGLLLLAVRDMAPKRLLHIAAGCLGLGAVTLFALAVVMPTVLTPLPSGQISGYHGSFAQSIIQRISDWPPALLWIVLFNGPVAFAAYCSGLAAAKTDFFTPGSAAYGAVRRRVPLLLAIGLPLNALYALSWNGALGEGLIAGLAFAGLALGGPTLAAVYLVGGIEAARRGWFQNATVAAGRMSLTAYVLEGIIAGFIFNGYGLGFYSHVGAFGCFGLAVAIYAMTHGLAALWLKRFSQGPLEWLLRLMTDRNGAKGGTASTKTIGGGSS